MFQLLRLPGFLDTNKQFKTQDYFIRIEHQQRGAPHAHILLWLVDENETVKRKVIINGEERYIEEFKPAPNFKNCVDGKKNEERNWEKGNRRVCRQYDYC